MPQAIRPLSHLRRFTPICAAVLLPVLLLATGCQAYRDVTTVPLYRQVRRSTQRSGGKVLFRKVGETKSIWATLQSFPYRDDHSAKVRALQEGYFHKVGRFPGQVVTVAYAIVSFPLHWIGYAFAAPVWYETDRDAGHGFEPLYWEEYPIYWVTRGYWLVDIIFHDIPFVAVAWPIRTISGKPYDWKDDVEVDAFDFSLEME